MKPHLSLGLIGGIAAALFILLSSSLFVVTQGEVALVLRFGAVQSPEDPVKHAGLHIKLPSSMTWCALTPACWTLIRRPSR